MTFDRDKILQLIQEKKWAKVIDLFKNNEIYSQIIKDPITNQIINTNFVNELISGVEISNDVSYTYFLADFHMLHIAKQHAFVLTNSDYEKLVLKLVYEYEKKGKKENAYKYALSLPNDKHCSALINEFEKEQPKVIKHSQQNDISVSENKEISKEDLSISLFKSKQEYTFYLATRSVYQSYMVFPNVSLTALIEWTSIKNQLTSKEQDYFFKALIDCVVIDQENSYHPIVFIELDSSFHDTEEQKLKDKMKNSIIGKAGHKLYRIRSRKTNPTEQDFIKLIREIIK